MKKNILVASLIVLSFEIFPQNLLKIGEIRNEKFNHVVYSPAIKIFIGKPLSIDANNDDISDFTIAVGHSPSCSNSPSCFDNYFESEEISKSPSTQFAAQYNSWILKDYSQGDTIINNVLSWDNIDASYIALFSNIWAGGPHYFAKNDSTYAGFRIITTQSDTLYGWIRIKDINYQEVNVFEFGCESSMKRDTILDNLAKTVHNESFSIIPNPVISNFTILQPKNKTITNLKITDLNGRIVKLFTYYSNKYDISELKPGVYILSFMFGKDLILKKIVKL